MPVANSSENTALGNSSTIALPRAEFHSGADAAITDHAQIALSFFWCQFTPGIIHLRGGCDVLRAQLFMGKSLRYQIGSDAKLLSIVTCVEARSANNSVRFGPLTKMLLSAFQLVFR
jgi:hypothetical protein